MQDRPSVDKLLAGVSRFLSEQILPGVEDRGQAFRLKVALYILATAQRELALSDTHNSREWASLLNLIGEDGPLPMERARRREEFDRLNAELASQIRAGGREGDEAVYAHLMETLREKLSVVQPRFDLRMECETPTKEQG